jgi:GntR family transcriptional regulator, arabinose operon transcriptional repressor
VGKSNGTNLIATDDGSTSRRKGARLIERGLRALDLRREGQARPKHERLKDHLVSEIIAGRIKPGESLLSEPRLVEMLGVARTTVRQAIASLENEGLIRRVKGKGTFVEDDARRKLKRGLDIFALVVPETRTAFYPSLLYGFDVAGNELHHQTMVCNTDNDIGRQADIILQLLDKKVGGVAINPTTEPLTPAHQIRQLQKQGIPVVFCHRRVEGILAPLLAIPFREVGHLAGKTLAEHGHQRVAFIDSHRSSVFPAYEEGLSEGLRAGGADASLESMCVADSIFTREEDVLATLEKVFKKPDPPTAIFAAFDNLAEMIYLLLPRLGLSVPDDVSLIGEGGTWREGAITRRLTSVVIDEVATGRKAVSLLHEMRRGERPIDDNEEFILPLSLSDGETLGTPKTRSQP